MRKILIAVAAVAVTATSMVGVASGSTEHPETTNDDFVTVAWKLPVTSSEWNKMERPVDSDPRLYPQALIASVHTGLPDLTAFDWLKTCGVYQIDVWYDTPEAAALIKDGVLTAQEASTSPLVYDDEGNGLWKIVDNGEGCVPTTPTTKPTTTTTAPAPTTTVTTAPAKAPTTTVAPAPAAAAQTTPVVTG